MTFNEFKEKYKDKENINDILDFLIKNGYESKDIRFNFEQAIIKEQKWISKLNQKPQINQGETFPELDLPNDFKIVRLGDQQSRNYEGFFMKNCVSSYTDDAEIYSLRDPNNIPKCTIELMNFEIIQIKGLLNGPVSPKYINYIVDFLKSKDIPVCESELLNIGYAISNPYLKEFITTHFKNYHFTTFGNNEYLFIKNPLKLIKKFNTSDNELFLFFCEFGQSLPALNQFLKNGSNVNFNSDSPIIYACSNRQFEVVKLLLKNKVHPGIDNGLPLFLAASNGNLKLVKMLMKHGADFSQNNYAAVIASINHIKILKYFVEKGFDINTKSIAENDPYSLLDNACSFDNFESVKFLIKNGFKAEDPLGAILFAIENNCSLKIVSLLMKKFTLSQSALSLLHSYSRNQNRNDIMKLCESI